MKRKLIVFAILFCIVTFGDTTFWKENEMLYVQTSMLGDLYFIYERSNIKYAVKMEHCNCHGCGFLCTSIKFDPMVASNTFGIFDSKAQKITEFPMPIYRHSKHRVGAQTPIDYNNFVLSAGENSESFSITITWKNVEGSSFSKSYVGKEEIMLFYKSLSSMTDTAKISQFPQKYDVFGDGYLMCTKANLVVLMDSIKKACQDYSKKHK